MAGLTKYKSNMRSVSKGWSTGTIEPEVVPVELTVPVENMQPDSEPHVDDGDEVNIERTLPRRSYRV